MQQLYSRHVAALREQAEAILEATGFEALVVHAGRPLRYFADDQDAPHRSTPHFVHWTPLEGPHHLLVVHPGKRPLLVRVAPEDYWYEQAPLGDPFWAAEFEVAEVASAEAAWKRAGAGPRCAYVGDAPDDARSHGIAAEACNPPDLLARLDWGRSFKSDYEVACLREATVVAARGHHAARLAFEGGASELDIHQAYVAAAGCVDKELPYESIVGLDEKGAILHYTGKRAQGDGRVLLIDSGARHLGYCSDITRTWTRADCDGDFRDLVAGLDGLQRALCDRVRPGLPYPELHAAAHAAIADLLADVGVLCCSGEEGLALGLTRPFFPHGLGHFLGVQVHDVAGHQAAPEGGENPPPAEHPFLRTTRTIEEGQVFTIEPGVYFIEMLLREHRSGPHAAHVDWDAVERLKPCGGARIEDNVVVTADGHENLTRPHV